VLSLRDEVKGVMDKSQPDQRTIEELIAESRLVAEKSDEIRRRMDELMQQIANRDSGLEHDLQRSNSNKVPNGLSHPGG